MVPNPVEKFEKDSLLRAAREQERRETKGMMSMSSRRAATMGMSVIPLMCMMWTSVSMVPLGMQCLMRSAECTRWGPEGGGYGNALWVTFFELFLVGTALSPSLVFGKRSREEHLALSCAPAGFVFGIKYATSHLALQETPAGLYALLHCSVIVFVAFSSWLVLNEKLSVFETVACFGLLLGTATTALDSSGTTQNSEEPAVSVLGIVLTLIDCALGGVVVVLLRQAMLRNKRAIQVTCLKTLFGALAVFPLALFVHGLPSIPSAHQCFIFLIVAFIILIYHTNLSALCAIAPAIVVAFVEALKAIPSFGIVALLRGVPETSFLFWLGAIIILASALLFKLARTAASHRHDHSFIYFSHCLQKYAFQAINDDDIISASSSSSSTTLSVAEVSSLPPSTKKLAVSTTDHHDLEGSSSRVLCLTLSAAQLQHLASTHNSSTRRESPALSRTTSSPSLLDDLLELEEDDVSTSSTSDNSSDPSMPSRNRVTLV